MLLRRAAYLILYAIFFDAAAACTLCHVATELISIPPLWPCSHDVPLLNRLSVYPRIAAFMGLALLLTTGWSPSHLGLP